MKFLGLGHVSIVVEDIEIASEFYIRVFGAIPQQNFPHFKNVGFAKSAGFLTCHDDVNVTIRFLEIPGTPVFLELMQYHYPVGDVVNVNMNKKANDIGGVGHICLKVDDVDMAFDFIKNQKDIVLINSSDGYKPCKIDNITPDKFMFFDEIKESDISEKKSVCKVIGEIKYFYFIDKHGIQWEFEQGHSDIGS